MIASRWIWCAFALALPSAADAQLRIVRGPVPSHELTCDLAAAPAARDRTLPEDAEAARLTNAATQALILGDFDGALGFLDRALRIDSTAIEAAYLRARVLLQAGRAPESLAAFCRVLALDPDGATAGEARDRLAEAAASNEEVAALHAAFTAALAHYDEGRPGQAATELTRILAARPAAASVLYDRAVVRAALEDLAGAREDLVAYRALVATRAPAARPADDGAVDEMLAWLDAELRGPSPAASLGMGMLLPGGGQFYTSRPWLGGTLLAATGGAVAAGLLVERVKIDCRVATTSGECPADQIASSVTERPLLLPAIGVAAGVWLLGAIEASLHARAARRPPSGGRQRDDRASRLELNVTDRAAELRVVIPYPVHR